MLVALALWLLAAALPFQAAALPDLHRAIDLGGLDARSAALILSGEEGGDLDISVLALPLEEGSAGRRVVLVIDILEPASEPRAEGPETDSKSNHVTEIYVYALDAQQQLAGYLTQGFQRDSVTHPRSPAGKARPGVLAGPQNADAPFEPTLRAVQDPWTGLSGRASSPRREREQDGVKFFGHLDLTPGSYSLRVLVLQRDFARMGLQIVPIEITAEANATDLASLDAAVAESWYLVMESGSADFPLLSGGQPVIPATRPPVAAVETEVQAAPSSPPVEPRRRRDVVAGYVEVLRLLVQGREAPAIQVLSGFERAGLGGEVEVVFVPSLMALAARLAGHDRESLVPLIHLHEKLYRQHYVEQDYRLATHARLMAVGLVEIYNKSFRAPDIAAGVLTADVFVSLGGFLQQLGSIPQARVVFEEALRHDPTNLAALLGLASIHEAFDDAREAVELLKRLLELHPDHAEARLRMAVNLRRLGAVRKAAALFRAGLEPAADTEDWIRSLAYQELARLYASQARVDDATALLTEALEWRPGHQRFHIQLAALYDHMEQGVKSRQVLERLDPEAGRRDESPRLVYSRWPSGDIEATRRRLAESAAGRLENLAEALNAAAGSGGE